MGGAHDETLSNFAATVNNSFAIRESFRSCQVAAATALQISIRRYSYRFGLLWHLIFNHI